jgi:hypothetical protein
MQIFTLVYHIDYEGEGFVGVFASREDAVVYRRAHCSDRIEHWLYESAIGEGVRGDHDYEEV